MRDIYEQHDAAFANVSAYVILDGAERVATIALKRSSSGLRVTAFVHWLGAEMAKGHADGGGYDKNSAAMSAAVRKIGDDVTGRSGNAERRAAFIDAGDDRDGRTWDRRLADAGFTVLQAV